ncbi:hypothetical protein Aoki45_02330 [Algoriphagus sp. oki45]|uniref:DUF6134 family protein n=1 Tax=Algoriphagus sp. oki45 TaxID=3067294 RepID=UPI0027FB713F|nr:hypothetical protein Aoki45_02330 [Algoriphagus sp. oki45]
MRKNWKTIRSKGRILLFLIGLMLFSQNSPAQEADVALFEVVVLGIKIGELEATRDKNRKDSLVYEVNSQVKFWFFGGVDVRFQNRSFFLKDHIVKTTSTSKTNRGDFFSLVRWDGDHYQVKADSYQFENRIPVSGPLAWCSTKLFFEEPSPQDIFLSEVYGLAQRIIQVEPGVYEIEINGNKNRYYYQSGKLDKIVLENPIKNYQIRRVK